MFNIPSFQAIEIKGYVKFFEKGGPFSIVHGTPCVFFCRLDLHQDELWIGFSLMYVGLLEL